MENNKCECDSLTSTKCCACRRAYYLAHKKEENESNRRWIKNNWERYQQKQKEYRDANPEKVKNTYNDWAKRNPVHSIWRGMKIRCYSPESKNYERYGGRGITVCDRWLGEDGYKNFESDMGPRPSEKYTLDRKDNNGNYEPDNCKWSTLKEQQRNTRKNAMVTINGRSQCVSAWAEESGIPRSAIAKRIKMGWPEEKLLEPPNPAFQRTRKP